LNSNIYFGSIEKSSKTTIAQYYSKYTTIQFSWDLDKWNSLHKNDKLGPKYEHENTLYYEKYQTIDLAFFLGST
jgi:hypothetical protein